MKLFSNSWVQATIIGLLVLFWFISGSFEGNKVEDIQVEEGKDVPISVKVSTIQAESHAVNIRIRSTIEAYQRATVRFQSNGIVEKISRDSEGTWVGANKRLCQLFPEQRKSFVAQAKASLDAAKLTFDGVRDLRKANLASIGDYNQAQATVKSAQANLQAAQAELDRTIAKAPFEGYVDELLIEEGDLASPGAACAKLVDLRKLRVIGYVPESDVGKIQVGQPIRVELVTGEVGFGEVSIVSKSADSKIRSFRVEAVLDNTEQTIRENISATMVVQTEAALTQKIPTSSIVLTDDGIIVVKSVNAQGEVISWPVEIVDQTPESLWVTGLPSTLKLIVLGQHYYEDGVKVDFVEQGSEG